MMNQSFSEPANNFLKLKNGLIKKDYNKFQHLSTKGRFVEPKIYSGFQHQEIKLTTVRRQSSQPRISSTRQIQRDVLSGRILDESFGQFQTVDPNKEESFIDFTGLNWQNGGKTPLIPDESLLLNHDSSAEFGTRLHADLTLRDLTSSSARIYRSSSMLYTSPSLSLGKSTGYQDLNIYSYNNFGRSARQHFFLTKRPSYRPVQSIFRSSSMHVAEPAFSRYSNNYDVSKTARV